MTGRYAVIETEHSANIAVPSTVTLSFVRLIPNRAACAAITVEQHAAREALKNHPGFGPVPAPPITGGISVSICSPDGPKSSANDEWRTTKVLAKRLFPDVIENPTP